MRSMRSSPHRLELVEQALGVAHGVDVPGHELLPPVSALGHQAGPFEHRHVLLHGREAHRVPPRQRRHRVLAAQARDDDVATGGVAQRVEHEVRVRGGVRRIYNHMVVGYAPGHRWARG